MMDPSSQGKIVSLPAFTKERRGRVASAHVRVAKTGNGPQWLDELDLTPRAGRQAEQEIDGLGRNPQPRGVVYLSYRYGHLAQRRYLG